MTTPPNYLGRIYTCPFIPIPSFWPFNAHLSRPNAYNIQIPLFSNQIPFQYVLPQQNLFNASKNAQFNSGISQVQARGRQVGSNSPIVRPNGGLQNKNQKKKKTNELLTVNLISDDEECVQLQKASEEKNTGNSSKINEYNAPANSPQTQIQKTKETKEAKIISKQRPQPKPKRDDKTYKTKQINKHTIIKIKTKSKNEPIVDLQKRGQVFSQRIVEKQDTRKEPFRISKRQRQLLQVSFLRQDNPIIMTGPQFQAKLPKYISDAQERKVRLEKIKNDLLSRQYKEQYQ